MFRMRYRHNKKSRLIPAHTYKKMQNVGKKKSSVLIQLSGWLRTLDMVRVTGLEPVRQRHTPLKRACLPIPAHSHLLYCLLDCKKYYIKCSRICQYLILKNLKIFSCTPFSQFNTKHRRNNDHQKREHRWNADSDIQIVIICTRYKTYNSRAACTTKIPC